jgi:hypothetical protein
MDIVTVGMTIKHADGRLYIFRLTVFALTHSKVSFPPCCFLSSLYLKR